MSIPESTLNKVRALLAKAEDTSATEAEAAAFTAKASDLMAKYGIDRAMAADRQPANDTPMDKIVTIPNPRANVKAVLLFRVAEAMRCQTIRLPHRKGASDGTQRVHVFGYTSDVERAEIMYTSLLLQMMNGLAQVNRAPAGVSIKTYKRSWGLGFAHRVGDRIEAVEQQAAQAATPQAEGRSAALVLADRSRVVDSQFRREYPRVAHSRGTHNVAGFGAGAEAGDRADIGQTRVGANCRAIGA
ncbi:DUF2786 domain-containing protein [Nocardiopsis eucommiae]|uniref:DUF2786 domain-containing protein n=1 Tax=Nocardiopsis eucommiae TaxID=2831970 RepID=A0A975QI11_9ACTN|nr:DUF2786 domain-containing protein [Nocardiopsis eucommiae]